MTNFDPTKPVQTRGGRKARVICTDADYVVPIVAVVDGKAYQYTATGLLDVGVGCGPLDLINIPERIEKWVNVYSDGECGFVRLSKEGAGEWRADEAVGCIKITLEDGKLISAEVCE